MAIRYDQIELSSSSFHDKPTIHAKDGSSMVRINTNYGYIELGPENTSHCHIQTDISNFYFNKEIFVNSGRIGSYDEDLDLRRAGTSKITAGENNIYIKEGVRIQEAWGQGDYSAEQLSIVGSYPSITLRDSTHNHKWLIHHDSSDHLQLYQGDTWNNNTWTRRFKFDKSGYFEITKTSGSMIATGASSDAFGYNADYGHYIAGNGGTYVYGNATYWDGSAARAILHAGNYGSYVYSESESDARFTSKDHFRSTGTGYYTSTTTADLITEALGDGAFNSYLTAHKTGWSYAGNGNLTDAGRLTELAGTSWLWWTDNSIDGQTGNITALCIAPNTGGSANKVFIYNNQGSGYAPGWREVWTSASDGSGSGLDADLLDGQQGSYYINTSNIGSQSVNYANSAGNADTIDGYHASSLWRSDGGNWNPSANILLNQSANGQEWSFDIYRNGYTGGYWHVWDSSNSTMLKVDAVNGKVYAPYNFVGDLEGTASNANTLDGIDSSSFFRDNQDRRLKVLRFTGEGGDSGNSSNLPYAIYQEGGSWSNPFPDLRIAYHVGIKLGANANYNGIRFYTDYDMSSQVMSVNNGADPLGGANVYVNNSLQAGSSLRAPIFYDSNNTNLYVDPSGTSVLDYVTATEYKFRSSTNNARFNGVSDWGTRLYTDSGYIQFGPANTGHAHIYTDRSNFYFNKQIQLLGVTTINQNDIRTPILYDYNNTGTYLNPAGQSKFNSGGSQETLILEGEYPQLTIRYTSVPDASIHFDAGYAKKWNVGPGAGGAEEDEFGFAIYSGPRGTHYGTPLRINAETQNVMIGDADHPAFKLDVRGDIRSTSGIRGTIFYDENNTAYYADPASTSNFSRLDLQAYSFFNSGLQVKRNIGTTSPSWQDANHTFSLENSDAGYISINFHRAGYTSNNIYYTGTEIITDDTFRSTVDMRAPIFYDSNDTTFFADFSSSNYSLRINGGIKFGSTNAESSGGFIGRHGSGGSLNTDAYPSPLYSIGDDYRPSGTGLSNHYGVGYAHTNASFYGLSGQSGWGFYVSADGDARVQLNGSNGTISCTGDVVAYASDGRLKENVKEIPNALDKVMKIRGVSYDWVKNIKEEYDFHPTKMHEVGVIAQEIQAVMPEVVTIAPFDSLYSQKTGWRKIQKQMEAELGREVSKAEAKTEYEKLPIEVQEAMQEKHNFLTVNYERLTALLIQAVKEQQEQIEELKTLINKS